MPKGPKHLAGTQKPLFRDFYLANIAHLNAGPQLPFEEDEAGYTRGFKIDPDSIYSYGIESNNVWIFCEKRPPKLVLCTS